MRPQDLEVFGRWVDEGFKNSYEKKLFEMVPLPSFLTTLVAPLFVNVPKLRGANRKRARGVLGEALISQGRVAPPEEEQRMRTALVERMRSYEARFADADQRWLLATPNPTAADFSLYGILERLVGDTGDAHMGTATPWLWEEARTPNLRAWHGRISDAHPIRFYGKTRDCRAWAPKAA